MPWWLRNEQTRALVQPLPRPVGLPARLRSRAICWSGISRANSRINNNVSSGTVQRCLPTLFILSVSAVWSPPCQCKTISMKPPRLARRSRAVPRARSSCVSLLSRPGGTRRDQDPRRAASSAAAPSLPGAPASSHRLRRSRLRSGPLPAAPRSNGAPARRRPNDCRDRRHHIGGGHELPKSGPADQPQGVMHPLVRILLDPVTPDPHIAGGDTEEQCAAARLLLQRLV